MSFHEQIVKFDEKAMEKLNTTRNRAATTLFANIVKMTPVDEGRAKGNWQFSVNQPAGGTLETVDKNGSPTIAKITQGIATSDNADTLILTNNLPYIHALEFGLYPNPPKRGSWDKRQKAWVIKSQGGYSKKAPAGMVRINIDKFNSIIQAEARK